MPFFVIKKGLVLLEWKYFPTPKILDPFNWQVKYGWFILRLDGIFYLDDTTQYNNCYTAI